MGNKPILRLNKPVERDPLAILLPDDAKAEFESTKDVPTSRFLHDYSHLPPPDERGVAPIQTPARTWGNPRLLGQGQARPGPQPLSVPPRGR